MSRLVALVTVARSDYGIYTPVLAELARTPGLRYGLLVSGAHLAPEFGLTVAEIERDGHPILARIDMLQASDHPSAVAAAMGVGTVGFGQALARLRPDLLVVLGDRTEMHAAAVAAVPFAIPIAHLHGGEITEGAIDNQLRHSLSKLSHLHFVSTRRAAGRLVRMGEEPWRIAVAGAPGLDRIHSAALPDRVTFLARVGLPDAPFLLVTYHPVTLEPDDLDRQIEELLAALGDLDMPLLITLANADSGGHKINAALRSFAEARSRTVLVENLGTELYVAAMAHAAAMAGNSSSGIIEAASLSLPVVNIGTRQAGRERSANVIDCGYHRSEIRGALDRALSPEFRAEIAGAPNVYGDGRAAPRIAERLLSVPLGDRLLRKRFHEPAGDAP